jgi:hypothetical protein
VRSEETPNAQQQSRRSQVPELHRSSLGCKEPDRNRYLSIGEEMKSWKTTIVGAGIAALMAVQNFQGNGSPKQYVIAALIAAFGFLSKDFDQTHAQ